MEPLNLLGSVLDFGSHVQGVPVRVSSLGMGVELAVIRAPGGWPIFLQSFLFENQWAWWISLLAAAVAVRFVGRFRSDRRLILCGWVLLGIAALWMATASLVVTPHERLQMAHKALATAAGNHDLATIASYLAPDFQSSNLGISRRADAEKEIQDRLKTYGIKSSIITSFHSEMLGTGDEAITQIVVLTTTDTIGSIPTTWELEWVDIPGEGWRIQHATMTRIGDQQVGPEHMIPR